MGRSLHLHPLLLLLPLLVSALTDHQKKLIVEKHNFYRSRTEPSAANMKALSWDSTLEELASSYATKCVWEHNEMRGFRGENLFLMSGSALDVDLGLADWHNERDFYNFTDNSCLEGKMCGHYTQMVWADTERVGCGEKFCEKIEGFEDGNMHLLVCNYEPPGNFQGEKPFELGEPCSACPETHSCKGSLCVDVNVAQEESSTGLPDATSQPPVPDTTEWAPITITELVAITTSELAPDTTELAPDTTEFAPDTTELPPATASALAPDTTGFSPATASEPAKILHSELAPDTTELAPDTTELASDTTELPPATASELAPDTTELASDTTGLLPATTSEPTPNTTLVILSEKPLEMTTLLESVPTTLKTESHTAPTLLSDSSPAAPTTALSPVPDTPTFPSEPTIISSRTGQIMDVSPSSPGDFFFGTPQAAQDSGKMALGAPDDGQSVTPSTVLDQVTDISSVTAQTAGKQDDSITEESGVLGSTNSPLSATKPSADSTVSSKPDRITESIHTFRPTPGHTSVSSPSSLKTKSDGPFSNDGPNSREVQTSPTDINVSPTSKKGLQGASLLVVKDQPIKDSPVQATPKPLRSQTKEPSKGQKEKKIPYSDPRKTSNAILEKQKSKFPFFPKNYQSNFLSKGLGYKSSFSGRSYGGNHVYSPRFGMAPRSFCPYPCIKYPLYRTNIVSPMEGLKELSPYKAGAKKPCKLFGYKKGIYSLYLPSKTTEENLSKPKRQSVWEMSQPW